MLQMFYQSVVTSLLFYTAVCWGGSMRWTNFVKNQAGTVIGSRLDTLIDVVEKCILKMVEAILNNWDHRLVQDRDHLYTYSHNFYPILTTESCCIKAFSIKK